ncbi:hypothetical protein OROGR_028665 [Orobanche gracilis]
MALSCYYSNWPPAADTIPSCYYFAQEEEETTKLPPELYNNLPLLQAADTAYCDVDTFFASMSPEDMLSFPEEYYNSLQQQLPYNNTVSSTDEYYYSTDEFQPAFHSIKRQKHIIDGGSEEQQLYCSDQLTSLTDYELQLLVGDNYNYLPAAAAAAVDDVTMIPTLPDFSTGPPAYSSGRIVARATTETGAGGGGGSSSPSAQSIAARHRRKKISDKTHELGKLIPGGQKMNTAEMFGAAHKYIKYLQAQVGILEFMASYHHHQEEEEEEESDQFHGLLESTLIQEKLYSTGKCMVPRKFVQELLQKPHHHHHVLIIKELRHLTEPAGSPS